MLIKLLTRLLVIAFFASITIFAWAKWDKPDVDYGDKLPGLYASANKRIQEAVRESKAKGECFTRRIKGTYNLNAYADGNVQPIKGNFNGTWADSTSATGDASNPGDYGASSTVSGTHENGTSDTASASK
ncbi:MAG: hypothetical protein OXU27_02390 [Candidatus Poribacteria bacterium]|nr:hypothetical protein [Candidatus Poribacteria bacterium]